MFSFVLLMKINNNHKKLPTATLATIIIKITSYNSRKQSKKTDRIMIYFSFKILLFFQRKKGSFYSYFKQRTKKK